MTKDEKLLYDFLNKSQYEVRMYYHGELVCPNPREHYMNTRSYEDMRREYDLLHCNEVTDEDIMKVYLANRNTNSSLSTLAISLIPFGLMLIMGLLLWTKT